MLDAHFSFLLANKKIRAFYTLNDGQLYQSQLVEKMIFHRKNKLHKDTRTSSALMNLVFPDPK